MITIRPIEEADAQAFLHLCTTLDHETTFMMLEPGERPQDYGPFSTTCTSYGAAHTA